MFGLTRENSNPSEMRAETSLLPNDRCSWVQSTVAKEIEDFGLYPGTRCRTFFSFESKKDREHPSINCIALRF